MGIIQKQGIANTIISYLGIAIGFVNIIYIQPQLLSSEEVGLLPKMAQTQSQKNLK
jgi:hypothetical protein